MEYCGIGDVIVNSNKFELILNRSFYSWTLSASARYWATVSKSSPEQPYEGTQTL